MSRELMVEGRGRSEKFISRIGSISPIGPISPIRLTGPIGVLRISWPILMGLICLLSGTVNAQTHTKNSFQHQQLDQERARAMATELVLGVLDVQLRQLEENGLEKLPIYAEIKSMRSNLDQLVDRQMQDVVNLLVKGQRSEGKDREQIEQEARGKIRTVVVSLMAERQKLHKRMHLAKLAAQIRQLIGSETKVLNRTRTLSEESPQNRERATLTTLEDQRDVAAIHFQFVDLLTDVATWEGPIGAGASKGLRLLKTLQIDQELRRADQKLAASDFGEAEKAEQAAIRAWRALLEVIEETQGLAGSDREAVMKSVAAMIKRQETVREETRKADARDQQLTERLAQREHEIHQDLGPLADTLREFANTEALAEQAKAAAFEAEAKLFDGAIPDATRQQSQVIGALAEIAKKLEQASTATSDKTADQLAQEVKQLEQLDQALDQIRAKQAEVTGQAADNAAAAKAGEAQVGQQLQQANQAADFGPALETRLTDAQDQVARTQQVLSNADPKLAAQRTGAAREATQALDLAGAEVKHALADSKRKQLAVEVGELARAAEALERAAAAEHQVADSAQEGAAADGLTDGEATALAKEQTNVHKVANEIAEGVKNTAPQAAQQLKAAEPDLQATEKQIQVAKQNPGEAAKPAAKQIAESATRAAKQLEEAAKQLRQQAGLSATELAQLAGQQLAPVAAARQAVDKALGAAQSDASPVGAVGTLQHALEKARAAQIEQMRAAGRAAAADAQQMMEQLASAVRQQNAAETAAREFAQGRTNSPLQAAAAQQQVGELTQEAAKRANGAVRKELEMAAAAAEEAAKEMVVGNPNSAAVARQTARDALTRAAQAAQTSAADAAKLPLDQPNPAAQQQVSALAQEAIAAAGVGAPQASESLGVAKQQSEAAVQALTNKQPPVVAEAQSKVAAALAKSVEQLQQAIQSAAKKESERAKGMAEQAAALANQSLPVDAGAAVALEQSANAAREAAADKPIDASISDPQPAMVRGLERATASLAAREQELQRDQKIAEAIAQLAKEQQAARDQIAAQSAKLENLAQKPDAPTAEPSKEEVAVAQALADAADKFAEAQRATGEGAAEISKQNEVANQPIRQGLEVASELGQMPTGKNEKTELASQSQSNGKLDQNGELKPASGKQSEPIGKAPQEADASAELGTDFVPRSPEETARQIAGKDVLEQAAKALASQPPTAADALSGERTKKSQLQTAENSANPEGSEPAPSEESAAARKGEATLAADQQGKNNKLDPTRLQQEATAKDRDSRAATGNNSTDPAARKFQEEPWFAKLPPSLQKAIQSKSRGNAPRGYEERLKRYFESQ